MPSAIRKGFDPISWKSTMERRRISVRELREWDKMETNIFELYFLATSRYKILKDVGYKIFEI